MSALILALGLSSSLAFAKDCYISDTISIDNGNYFSRFPEVVLNGLFGNSDAADVSTKWFKVRLKLDKKTHTLTYVFLDPSRDLKNQAVTEEKQIIIDADSLSDADHISSAAVEIAPGTFIQARIWCHRDHL